jgi:hypothetical protein
MPNGHGGIPRWGSPLLLLVLLSILIWVRLSEQAVWTVYVAYPLAALLAWRFAWHLCLYDVMEYGGGYTSPDKLQKARSLYIKMLLALVPGAILCVYLFWP